MNTMGKERGFLIIMGRLDLIRQHLLKLFANFMYSHKKAIEEHSNKIRIDRLCVSF